jgi:hypothetical protein
MRCQRQKTAIIWTYHQQTVSLRSNSLAPKIVRLLPGSDGEHHRDAVVPHRALPYLRARWCACAGREAETPQGDHFRTIYEFSLPPGSFF